MSRPHSQASALAGCRFKPRCGAGTISRQTSRPISNPISHVFSLMSVASCGSRFFPTRAERTH
eukprot:11656724-Alexandrium_andersonii.AAC.1